jgi:hypothetical protein
MRLVPALQGNWAQATVARWRHPTFVEATRDEETSRSNTSMRSTHRRKFPFILMIEMRKMYSNHRDCTTERRVSFLTILHETKPVSSNDECTIFEQVVTRRCIHGCEFKKRCPLKSIFEIVAAVVGAKYRSP